MTGGVEGEVLRQPPVVLERHLHEDGASDARRLVEQLARMLHVFDHVAQHHQVEVPVRMGKPH